MTNIALIGFGHVGRGFVEIIRQKATTLTARYGFEPRIVAVATGSRGSLVDPAGLDGTKLLDDFANYPGGERGWSPERIVRESNADVIVEVSPSNLQTAQPALGLCHAAFDAGKHVVLANKGPVALAYRELADHAARSDKSLRFEATVMAGTPSLRLALQALAGAEITAVRGILNGTTNYILTQMESGMDYAEALQQAQTLGYAETDPSGDVDGWDAAGKVLILAASVFRLDLKMGDLRVRGITGLTTDDIASARSAGQRWKLIASVSRDGGAVEPEQLSLDNPLAGVTGATNAITLTTDMLGDVTLVGPGAGGRETGFAILSDLLDIAR